MNKFKMKFREAFIKALNLRNIMQNKADARILQLNRLYATLSQINQLIVRSTDKARLYSDICNVAVEYGQFRMAWIGLLDEGNQFVYAETFAGHEQGYLSSLKIAVSDEKTGRGPTGTAIREGRCVFCQDIATDPRMLPWRNEALKRGFRSSASVPFRQNSKVMGVLNLYASDPSAFGEEEVQLIEEISADISFALDMIEREKQRALATLELQASENRIRELLENVNLISVFLDLDGKVTYCNSYLLALTGYSREELIGSDWFEKMLPVANNDTKEIFLEALKNGEISIHFENPILTKKGESLYIFWNNSILKDVAGSITGTASIGEDITGRKFMMEKLKVNEARLLKGQEIGKFGFWQQELESNFIWASEQAKKIYGFPGIAGELPRETISACINDIELVRQAAYNLIHFDKDYNIEFTINPADGSPQRMISAIAELEKDQNGKPVRIAGVLNDITERKQAEEALIKSEERLRLSTELANVAVWEYDFSLNQMSRSNNHDGLYGMEIQDHWDINTFTNATHPDDRELSNSVIQAAVASGGPDEYQFDFRVIYPDSSVHWLNVTGQVIKRDQDGNGIVVRGCLMDITQRKETEIKLNESEARYRLLFENMNTGFALFKVVQDENGVPEDLIIVAANKGFEITTGLKIQEVTGKRLTQALPGIEKDAADWIGTYGKIALTGESRQFEQGSDLLGFYYTINAFQASPGHCGVAFIDITSRKSTEIALQESEIKFRNVFEHSIVGKSMTGIDGTMLVNQAFCNIVGYTKEELETIKWTEITHQDDIAMNTKWTQSLIEGKISKAHFEKRYIHKNGTIIWTDVFTFLQKDNDNKPKYFITSIIDITERKLSAIALVESEIRYRLLFENMLDAVAYHQIIFENDKAVDYIYLNVNDSFKRLTGLKDVVGRRVSEIVPGIHETNPELIERFGTVVLTGIPVQYETFISSSNTWFYTSLYFLEKDIVVSMFKNITEQKKADEAIQKYQNNLEELVASRTAELAIAKNRAESADKLKSAFLAIMSHELRTPLNSIIGFTGILYQEFPGKLNKEQKKQLEMIRNSSRHLLSLVNDILDLSKIEAGQLKIEKMSFNLPEVIQKVVKTCKPLSDKKNIQVDLSIEKGIKEIKSDKFRVEQIVLNLLNNAIKFTDAGSVIITCSKIDKEVIIKITDTGIGIEKEKLHELFRPFVQVDNSFSRKHEGTGLGLSICKRLTELLDGSISVESEIGVGSTFAVNLPLQ